MLGERWKFYEEPIRNLELINKIPENKTLLMGLVVAPFTRKEQWTESQVNKYYSNQSIEREKDWKIKENSLNDLWDKNQTFVCN